MSTAAPSRNPARPLPIVRGRMTGKTNPLEWDKLTDSGKKAVADLITLLAGRFTGTIVIECVDGGVREFLDTRRRRGDDLGTLAQNAKRN